VAAIVERDGRFLLVEERVADRRVLNQPAGHLEPDEDLLAAVRRETREETGHGFRATALVGIYHWQVPETAQRYVRFAFCGELTGEPPAAELDPDIERVLWLNRAELARQAQRLRSPLVLAGIDDYLAGRRFPLEILRSR